MSPQTSSLRPSRRTRSVEALLRDLGPQLRRGEASEERLRHCPTGIDAVDRLLGGGVPRGRLCEIAGPVSSGRTSLAQSLLACATRAGEVVAVVDPADAFDPASAERAGVVLERVLWVRPPRLRAALKSAERLLQTRGLALVLLDLVGLTAGPQPDPRPRPAGTSRASNRAPASAVERADGAVEEAPLAAWLRLARAAAASGTALVVLAERRCTATAAERAVELAPPRACFRGVPALLESAETRVALVRGRGGGLRDAPLRLQAA